MSDIAEGGFIIVAKDGKYFGMFWSEEQAEAWARENEIEIKAVEYLHYQTYYRKPVSR